MWLGRVLKPGVVTGETSPTDRSALLPTTARLYHDLKVDASFKSHESPLGRCRAEAGFRLSSLPREPPPAPPWPPRHPTAAVPCLTRARGPPAISGVKQGPPGGSPPREASAGGSGCDGFSGSLCPAWGHSPFTATRGRPVEAVCAAALLRVCRASTLGLARWRGHACWGTSHRSRVVARSQGAPGGVWCGPGAAAGGSSASQE